MNIRWLFQQTELILPGLLTLGVALATPPIPITADDAFDAVTMEVDPESGNDANVALIDIRDTVEYFSSGAAAKATEIQLLDQDAEGIDPDGDKVRLVQGGKFVEYSVDGRYRRMLVSKISSIRTEPLAFNIPFWRRTATSSAPTPEWDKTGEAAFYQAVSDLVYDEQNELLKYDVLILYCRTGGRSSAAGEGIPVAFDFSVEVGAATAWESDVRSPHARLHPLPQRS
jgi:rhodanese-related sulfurtransferase